MILVTVEDLVAGLARDAELTARVRHRLALQKLGDKAQAFLHCRTLGINTPRKKPESVTHVSGTFCHLCLGPLILRS
jgi:hypothetical protein